MIHGRTVMLYSRTVMIHGVRRRATSHTVSDAVALPTEDLY
jgi:hypothetical protein